MLSQIDKKHFIFLRSQTNPYEWLGKSIFMNRAAVKMANIDYLFEKGLLKGNGYQQCFLDLCGGPGGFSQYLLYKYPRCQGIGITLEGPDDWDIDKMNIVNKRIKINMKERFSNIKNNKGDIMNKENIEYMIMNYEDNIDLVVADGAFDMDIESNQEIESYSLFYHETYIALKVLKIGGHYVIKIFDISTFNTVNLIYYLYECFERVEIYKPYSSRPANSERYIVCKSLKYHYPEINIKINESVAYLDIEFINQLLKCNEQYINRQVQFLQNIISLSNMDNITNYVLSNEQKIQIVNLLLKEWKLPLI